MITLKTARIRFPKVVAVLVSKAPRSLPLRSKYPITCLVPRRLSFNDNGPSHGPLRFITSRSPRPCQKQSAWGGGCPITLHQSVAQKPIRYNMTLHFRDRRGAASLRCRNRTEITYRCCVWTEYGMVFLAGAEAIRCLIPLLVWEQVCFLLPIHYTDLFFQCNTQLDSKTVVFFLFSKSLGCSLRVSHARSDEPHTLVISLPFFSLAPDLLFDCLRVHTDCFAN